MLLGCGCFLPPAIAFLDQSKKIKMFVPAHERGYMAWLLCYVQGTAPVCKSERRFRKGCLSRSCWERIQKQCGSCGRVCPELS